MCNEYLDNAHTVFEVSLVSTFFFYTVRNLLLLVHLDLDAFNPKI